MSKPASKREAYWKVERDECRVWVQNRANVLFCRFAKRQLSKARRSAWRVMRRLILFGEGI